MTRLLQTKNVYQDIVYARIIINVTMLVGTKMAKGATNIFFFLQYFRFNIYHKRTCGAFIKTIKILIMFM